MSLAMPGPVTFASLFDDPASSQIYTLSLHDALPIWPSAVAPSCHVPSSTEYAISPIVDSVSLARAVTRGYETVDRKSTRLNSSHQIISYAVFCLKKKKGSGARGGRREHDGRAWSSGS